MAIVFGEEMGEAAVWAAVGVMQTAMGEGGGVFLYGMHDARPKEKSVLLDLFAGIHTLVRALGSVGYYIVA